MNKSADPMSASRLAQFVALVVFVVAIFQPMNPLNVIVLLGVGAVGIGIMFTTFAAQARKTHMGVGGHWALEKKFLTNELPNIVQITTVLSIFGIYLNHLQLRAILALVVAFILHVYLKSRREDYFSAASEKSTQDVSPAAVKSLHGAVAFTLGALVFVVAELIAIQSVMT